MEYFCQKTRLDAGGHMANIPAIEIYSSVISSRAIQISLSNEALNALNVMAAIKWMILQCPTKER